MIFLAAFRFENEKLCLDHISLKVENQLPSNKIARLKNQPSRPLIRNRQIWRRRYGANLCIREFI